MLEDKARSEPTPPADAPKDDPGSAQTEAAPSPGDADPDDEATAAAGNTATEGPRPHVPMPDDSPGARATAPPPSRTRKRRRGPRKPRSHPYAHEASPSQESRVDPRVVTLLWFLGSVALVWGGYLLQTRFGFINPETTLHPHWELWNSIPLVSGLLLLLVSVRESPRRTQIAMAGWILFGVFWALTARDALVGEDGGFWAMVTAMLMVPIANYFAYHEWLNMVRGVKNFATRYLAIVAVAGAGFYFLIAKIVPFRLGLVRLVARQTKWMLDLFGMGDRMGLEFVIDEHDIFAPTSFRYPDTHELCPDGTEPMVIPGEAWCLQQSGATNWLQDLMFWIPPGEAIPGAHGLLIVWVTIILACTALQVIALFVGLFMGTAAPMRQRIFWSLGVGAIIYVLNLMRNTFVIWTYGRGHMSFFIAHDVLARLFALVTLVGIALVAFKRLPPFLDALNHVLDMPHRDGPIERTLRVGRRRPQA